MGKTRKPNSHCHGKRPASAQPPITIETLIDSSENRPELGNNLRRTSSCSWRLPEPPKYENERRIAALWVEKQLFTDEDIGRLDKEEILARLKCISKEDEMTRALRKRIGNMGTRLRHLAKLLFLELL